MTDIEDILCPTGTSLDGQDDTGLPDDQGKITVTVHKDKANIPIGVELHNGIGTDNNLYLGKIDPDGVLGSGTTLFVQGMRVLSINGLSCLGLEANDAAMILQCMQGNITIAAAAPLHKDFGSSNSTVEFETVVQHDKLNESSLQPAEEGGSLDKTLTDPTLFFLPDNPISSPPKGKTSNSDNGSKDEPRETSLGDEITPKDPGGELDETPKGGDGSINGCLRDWHCKLTVLYICGWIYFIAFLKNKAKYGNLDSCDDLDTDDWYSTDDSTNDCPTFWVDLWIVSVSVCVFVVRKSRLVLFD